MIRPIIAALFLFCAATPAFSQAAPAILAEWESRKHTGALAG